MKTVDFSETIAASDLKVGRCIQLIEFMKVLKVKVISLPYIFLVFYVLCFARPIYQVSVYRTIGPFVSFLTDNISGQYYYLQNITLFLFQE